MPALDAKFSTFVDGGDLVAGDIVVGLRDGLNTKFLNTGGVGTFLPLAGGTMTGPIEMSDNKITGLALCTDTTDAASKAYVDSVTGAVGATGTFLRSNGSNWVASTATIPNTYALGDMIYGSATNVLTAVAGNITAVKQYLSQTGTGAVSAAPVWATISGGDITGAALSRVDDTNVTMTLGGTPTTALLRAVSMTLGWTGQLSVARGGSGAATLTGLLTGNGTSAFTGTAITQYSILSGGASNLPNSIAPSATSGVPIISQGASAQPVFGTAVVAGGGTGNTTFTAYSVICAGTSSTGAFQNVSGVGTANQVLVSNGAAALPSWQSVPGLSPAALTKTDDTNVTLTLGGTPTTALLQATSITAGWTGQLSLARGGTNANLTAANGAIPYSTASAFALLAAGTSGQLFQSGGAGAPNWTTATFPSTAASAGTILRANGTNWVASSSTFADTYAASSLLYSNGANTVTGLATANSGILITSTGGVPSWKTGTFSIMGIGGGAADWFTPSVNGSIAQGFTALSPAFTPYSMPSSTLTANGLLYASTTTAVTQLAVGTSGQFLQSGGAGSAPAWSTATFPATGGASGNILISNGTNYIASTSLWPNTVGTAGKIIRSDGTTNAYTTSTFADTYAVSTILYASSANTIAGLATANSGVLVTSSGGVPSISSTLPAFTTSAITFSPTTGGIVGTTTNDDAAAGKVGEFVSSIIAAASAVTLANNTNADVTSISLTAGDWDVWGNVTYVNNTGTVSYFQGWISTTSATGVDASLYTQFNYSSTGNNNGMCVPQRRMSLSGTTTVYLSVVAGLTAALKACGGIYARRVR